MNGPDRTEPTSDVVVTEIDASQTHDLRRRVLRVGTPSTALEWVGDNELTTVHLGTFRSNSHSNENSVDRPPTAISTWLVQPSPDVASTTLTTTITTTSTTGTAITTDDAPLLGVQLRGMATDPRVRGEGHGTLLLNAGVERARRLGADHVWANARSAALGFYVARGFDIVSDEFDSADTALPHRRILLRFDRTE